MGLAVDEYMDGTITPTEQVAGTILPAGQEAITTPEKPIDCNQKGTPKPNRPATPTSESCNSDNNTEDEKYLSYFLE